MAYLYNRLKGTIACNLYEFQNNYAEWKKSDKRKYLMDDLFYIKSWEIQATLQWQKTDQWLSEDQAKEEWIMEGHKETSECVRNVH